VLLLTDYNDLVSSIFGSLSLNVVPGTSDKSFTALILDQPKQIIYQIYQLLTSSLVTIL